MRDLIRRYVADLEPHDDVELEHQHDVLDWIDSGAPIWRLSKPATPPKHLVSYCALVDAVAEKVLLVDHRLAGLWLPTGGHVEVDEDPADAAAREMSEELSISARFHRATGRRPLLVTVTETVGNSKRHTDVSLWFALEYRTGDLLSPDRAEFADARWWSFDDITGGDRLRFDPNLPRFIDKLRSVNPARS